MAYEIDNRFNLAVNEGSSSLAQNFFIALHETANSRATGENEATFMKRNWRNAYTTHIVGDGKVYVVGEPGYVSYGALNANPYSPAQIELQHTLDKELFKKNYAIYIELIRDMCNKFNIPKTLDTSGKWTKGCKSHDWLSKNFGGDHTDPYGYLSKMGISKSQFAKDIANGIKGGETPVTKPKVKDGFWDTAGKIEILQDVDTWNKDFTKKDPNWKFKKGSVIDTSGIVVTPSGSTHARVGENPNLFITLNKNYVKRVPK